MTNKERELLLRDLCGRCHTFLYVNIKGNIQVLNSWADDDGNFFNFLEDGPDGNYGEGFTLDDVKPYLRHLSSMSEEEEREYNGILKPLGDFMFEQEEEFKPIQLYKSIPFELYDFFIDHHLDFRGLIPMGLALEATKDMYLEDMHKL